MFGEQALNQPGPYMITGENVAKRVVKAARSPVEAPMPKITWAAPDDPLHRSSPCNFYPSTSFLWPIPSEIFASQRAKSPTSFIQVFLETGKAGGRAGIDWYDAIWAAQLSACVIR